MASRMKEDERNERVIRGLLKLPGNRKCINCNVMGPQYVCITFSTFVCTTCGGIHREFTHRVKSVSMAKFTPQEIASLQAGGNERAREIFFKDWDPQRVNAPDSSNVDKLRTFIKHVYVDRRYAGEKGIDRPPPRAKMGDKEEPNENRRSDSSQSGSRSPPYDDERRYSDRPSPGHDVRRSPGYDQDSRRHSDYGRSPVRPGIVSDWRREDRFSNGRRLDDRRSSDGESKPEMRSPDSQNGSISSPPAVRPVRDILGENVVPLRISEPPRASSSRVAEGSAITQRTASLSSLASSNGNPTELKRETSLIDFDAFSEPAAVAEVQQSTTDQSVAQSTSRPSDDNWACFDNVPETNVSQTPPSVNQLDSVLTELSVPAPAPAPAPVSSISSGDVAPRPSIGMFPSSSSGDFLFESLGGPSTTTLPGASLSSSSGSLSSFPSGGVATVPGIAPTIHANGGTAQWRGMQNPQQPSNVAVNQPAAPPSVSAYPSGLSSQGVTGNPVAQAQQASHTVAQAPPAIPAPAAAQTVEAKARGRNELPMDLFTATYSATPYQGHGYQGHGWQTGPVPGMGYPMQYNTAMAMPAFLQPNRSSNPFDANAEALPSQAAAFPSMSSLQTALPNMAVPGGPVHGSSLGGARPSWVQPHASPYKSAVPPHGSSFGPAVPGAYMGHQLPSNMPPTRPQGFGSFGSEGSPFGSQNTAAAPQNPSLGGNPFG